MSGSSGDETTPSASITIYSPSDTGRPQQITIVPQYTTLRNQVLAWNPDTGEPEWRLLTDVESEGMFGGPIPLLFGDNLPLLAGDGLPYLFRPSAIFA